MGAMKKWIILPGLCLCLFVVASLVKELKDLPLNEEALEHVVEARVEQDGDGPSPTDAPNNSPKTRKKKPDNTKKRKRHDHVSLPSKEKVSPKIRLNEASFGPSDVSSQEKLFAANKPTDVSSQKRQESQKTSFAAANKEDAPDIPMEDFRICRVDPTPVLGQPPVSMKGLAMGIKYQCSGNPYHQFAHSLEKIIRSESATRQNKKAAIGGLSRWGQRNTLVPPATTGRTILIMGNSHTAQLVSTLLCQYKDQILGKPKYLYSMPQNHEYGVLQIQLENNLTVYAATNFPIIYSRKWQQILETKILQRPLSSLDAIVLGRFNQFSESTGTKFYDNMIAYQKLYPDMEIDFETAVVPTLEDIAKIYKGPIVYVGMFAKYATGLYKDTRQTIDGLKNDRHNLKAIDGRRYIRRLQKEMEARNKKTPEDPILPVHECSSDTWNNVTTCILETDSYRFINGHRCQGSRGGHPDLIAFDTVDVLHELLRESTTSTGS